MEILTNELINYYKQTNFINTYKGIKYLPIYMSLFIKANELTNKLYLTDNELMFAYISIQDLKEIEKKGFIFVSNEKEVNEYISNSKFLLKKGEKYISEFNEDLATNFSNLSNYLINLLKHYCLTEYIFYGLAEREILKNINKKINDPKKSHKEISNLLSENYEKILNTKEYKNKKSELILDKDTEIIIQNFKKIQIIRYVIRKFLTEIALKKNSIFPKILEKISETLNIKKGDIFYLNYNEIKLAMENKLNNIEINNIILDRKNGYIFLKNQNGNFEFISGAAYLELKNIIHKKIQTNIKEIKGTIASYGKKIGKAKIIPFFLDSSLINENLQKIKKGDIIVADSTGPELVIACKKASAIVADLGGLTSHAAILSRELGIPCIVGTKYATLIIKDNDVIEVDATKGIVRILKTN